jgi:hypothetical protein
VTRLLLLLLSFCAPALATNWAFVQQSPVVTFSSTPSLTQAFSSVNTAGNVIIAIVYFPAAGTVSDTQGNTYTLIQGATVSASDPIEIFAAVNIHAGSNTVTVSAGRSIFVAEFSSTNSTYSVCPAIGVPGTGTSGTGITSNGISPDAYINPVSFTSPSEVMAVFAGATTLAPGTPYWTIGTGTIMWTASYGSGFNGGTLAGYDDVSSVTGTYSDAITAGNFGTSGSRTGVFLTQGSICLGSGGKHTFAILY